MRKVFAGVMMLLLVASAGMIGCGQEAEEPAIAPVKELAPVEVRLASVYPDFAGKESITFSPVFVISNPNDYMVTVDTLEYWLSGEGKLIAAVQLTDDLYIPANTEVSLKDSVTVGIEGLIGEKVFAEGLPILQAMLATLPLWHVLGGQCIPAPAPGAEDAVKGILGKVMTTAEAMGMTEMFQGLLKDWTGEEELAKQAKVIAENPEAYEQLRNTLAQIGQELPSTVDGLRFLVQGEVGKMITGAWEEAAGKGATFTAEGTAYITSEAGSLELKFAGLSWQAEPAPEIAGH